MTLQKVLWFGHPNPAIESSSSHLGDEYYVEQLPLNFKLDYLEFLGQYAAAIIQHYNGQEDSFRLLRNLRNRNPNTPLIVLAKNLTTTEVIEAFRTGATDCIQEPIDLEGLFLHVKRHVSQKVTPKIGKIKALLLELGKKITETIYAPANPGIVSQPFTTPGNNEKKLQPTIKIDFFGQFDIAINGKRLECELSTREKSLLAYLAFHHGRGIHRDRLIERFWADSSADSAKNSMHVAITGIRRCLESICPDYNFISCQKQMYHFNPSVDIITDVRLFLQHFREALSYERNLETEAALYAYHKAFGYYRDEFLVDLEGSEWVTDERDRLREKYIIVLKNLSEYFIEYKQFDFAINLFHKILDVDDCYEWAHRNLMKSYYDNGMKDQAIRQYQKCVEILDKKLEVKPSSETVTLYQFICK